MKVSCVGATAARGFAGAGVFFVAVTPLTPPAATVVVVGVVGVVVVVGTVVAGATGCTGVVVVAATVVVAAGGVVGGAAGVVVTDVVTVGVVTVGVVVVVGTVVVAGVVVVVGVLHWHPPGGVGGLGGTMLGGVGAFGAVAQPVVQSARFACDAPAVAAYTPSPARSTSKAPVAIAFISLSPRCRTCTNVCATSSTTFDSARLGTG